MSRAESNDRGDEMTVHPRHQDDPGLLRVTQKMVGVHPIHTDYPLLPGDVLTLAKDGTYTKHTGLGMWGFTLTPEQAATLEPAEGRIVLHGSIG